MTNDGIPDDCHDGRFRIVHLVAPVASAPHCTGPCHQGRLPCPTPQACGIAAAEPDRRAHAPLLLDGPHLPSDRRGWLRVLVALIGITGAWYIAGTLVGRFFGA